MMTMSLFVQFKSDKAVAGEVQAKGFTIGADYPVFCIDPFESEEGEDETRFLVSNRDGNFHWFPMTHFKRAPAMTYFKRAPAKSSNGSIGRKY